MRRLMMVMTLGAAAMLAACTPVVVDNGPVAGGIPPAYDRCDATATVDSRAVCVAFRGFDLALTAIDGLRDAGVIVRGTPRALAVQAAIRETQTALNDASAIQRGVRSGDLAGTLLRAAAALNRLRAAIS